MLSVNPIARVIVNAVRSSAAPASFDTGLLLIRDASFVAAHRLAVCDSPSAALSQLTAWGFASSSDPYKSAVKYFAASPAPSRLLLSCYPASESLAQALGAVLDITASFYGVALGQTETDARMLALDEFISGLDKPLSSGHRFRVLRRCLRQPPADAVRQGFEAGRAFLLRCGFRRRRPHGHRHGPGAFAPGLSLRPVLQDDQRHPAVGADGDRGGCHQGPVRECVPDEGIYPLASGKGHRFLRRPV